MIYWYSFLAILFVVACLFGYKANTSHADSGMAYAIMAVFIGGGSILAAIITAIIQWILS